MQPLNEKVSSTQKSYLMDTYSSLPVRFADGKGCWLISKNGESILMQ